MTHQGESLVNNEYNDFDHQSLLLNNTVDINQPPLEYTMSSGDKSDITDEPYSDLRELRFKNINRIIVTHLNINSIRNKFEEFKDLVINCADIAVVSETKINPSFTTSQFEMEGFQSPFRADRNLYSGGILVYIRQNIPAK